MNPCGCSDDVAQATNSCQYPALQAELAAARQRIEELTRNWKAEGDYGKEVEAQRDRLQKRIAELGQARVTELTRLTLQLCEMTAQRGRLAEALRLLLAYPELESYVGTIVYKKAEAALANLPPAVDWRALGNKLAEALVAYDPPMPDALPGETHAQYTDRLTGADGKNKRPYSEYRNRQCSIGYHNECSDPDGEICKCPCHQFVILRAAALRAFEAATKGEHGLSEQKTEQQ